ncbi:hypothetical protein AVEN_147255-1 [Araneus ventricosus]|uniref:Uncharacterized protein n=1 Tax=Araneus ventricosus TaxID=182803 RepID=A0A4Y2TTD3_ARAVE|nr:hypothetical protein AVEN_147255-1 [Araneus ventricosus]
MQVPSILQLRHPVLKSFSERNHQIFLQLRHQSSKSFQSRCHTIFCSSSDISLQIVSERVPYNFCSSDIIFKIIRTCHTILQLRHQNLQNRFRAGTIKFCSSDISLQNRFRAGAPSNFLQLEHVSLQNRFGENKFFARTSVFKKSFQCRCHQIFAALQTSVFKIVSEQVPSNFCSSDIRIFKSFPERVPYNFLQLRHQSSKITFQSGIAVNFAAQTSIFKIVSEQVTIKFLNAAQTSVLKSFRGTVPSNFDADIQSSKSFQCRHTPNFATQTSVLKSFQSGTIQFFAAQTSIFKIVSGGCHQNICSSDISLQNRFQGASNFLQLNIQSSNAFQSGCHTILQLRHQSFSNR